MAKFDALKFYEEEIQIRVNTLKNIEIANLYNNPNIEIEMCQALLEVFNTVKNIEETRWGRAPLESDKNLSWIVSKNINPVLLRVKNLSGTSISNFHMVNINNKSKNTDVEKIAIFLRKQLYFGQSEKNALAFLAQSLFYLIAHYSPAKKKAKKGDGAYCLYCYRECYRLDSDTCDKHSSVNRTKGKWHFKKYVEMKDSINNYEKDEESPNLKIFNSIALKALKDRKISAWLAAPDKNAWLAEVLKVLDIFTNQWEIESKTKEFLKLMNGEVLQDYPHWPSSLNGTMFRYQAYILAKHRRPTTKIIKKLKQVWSGQKIITVAKKSKVHRSGLQRAVIDWRNKINLLRADEVPDELIKVALGLKFLPIRKSGGAANKNLPKQI